MKDHQSGRSSCTLAEIGMWTAGMGTGGTVEETSRAAGFWDLSLVPREELEAFALNTSAVPVHELVAVVDPEWGDTVLADGCHLYAAARDLGAARLPVRWDQWAEWFGDG